MADGPQHGVKLEGERVRAPRGLVATLLVTLSGWLLLEAVVRLFARAALGYRRPASVALDEKGIVISDETHLLGRTLSERRTVVPTANLSQIERETRYARLGLFAGLLALSAGTYVGVGLMTDGVRVPGGSPSLLGLGALFVALGVLVDYGLSLLERTVQGTCRLVVERRSGAALCISGLAPESVDALLTDLRRALPPEGTTPALSEAKATVP